MNTININKKERKNRRRVITANTIFNTMKKAFVSLLVVSTLLSAGCTTSMKSDIISTVSTVEAKTKKTKIKLNATKKTITKGKSTTLKITGTKKKVKWSTSNKKIATVSSKGKVTAKKKGTCYIYAKVSGKTYKCKITVKNPTKAASTKNTTTKTSTSTKSTTSTNVNNTQPQKQVSYNSSVTSKQLSLTGDYRIHSIVNLNNRSNPDSKNVIEQLARAKGKTESIYFDNFDLWLKNCRTDFEDFNPLGTSWNGVRYANQSSKVNFETDYIKKQYHLNNNVASMLSQAGVTVGMSDEEAVRRIADYICKITTYDVNYATGDDILVYGKGRCSSYAVLMKTMANACGIQCDYVRGEAFSGESFGSHAWNRIKVHGTYYYIDVCWMDASEDDTYYLTKDLWEDHFI